MEEALGLLVLRIGLALADFGYLIVDLVFLVLHGREEWRLRRAKRREAAKRRKK